MDPRENLKRAVGVSVEPGAWGPLRGIGYDIPANLEWSIGPWEDTSGYSLSLGDGCRFYETREGQEPRTSLFPDCRRPSLGGPRIQVTMEAVQRNADVPRGEIAWTVRGYVEYGRLTHWTMFALPLGGEVSVMGPIRVDSHYMPAAPGQLGEERFEYVAVPHVVIYRSSEQWEKFGERRAYVTAPNGARRRIGLGSWEYLDSISAFAGWTGDTHADVRRRSEAAHELMRTVPGRREVDPLEKGAPYYV
jgi:hypothetical protein